MTVAATATPARAMPPRAGAGDMHTAVFALDGLHTGDLLMALPAIGAMLAHGEVVVSGLAPRYYRALSKLPVAFRHMPPPEKARIYRPNRAWTGHRTDGWLQVLPGRPDPVRVRIPLHGLARAVALLDAGPWAVLSPWADYPRKRWLVDRWTALADRVARSGYRVAVIGPPSAMQMAQAICGTSHANLVGCDLPETWPALLTRAAVVVSTDTACVHMADALGIPVVGLYGYTAVEVFGPYWNRDHCVGANGMDAIGVSEVERAIEAARTAHRWHASVAKERSTPP